MIWNILNQIVGILLIVLITIFVYKIFIASHQDKNSIPQRA